MIQQGVLVRCKPCNQVLFERLDGRIVIKKKHATINYVIQGNLLITSCPNENCGDISTHHIDISTER